MAIAVKVTGTESVVAAFEGMSSKSRAYVTQELTPVANSIRDSARRKISRYSGASLNTILAKVRPASSTIYVVQDANPTTGLHPNFGYLQMKNGFIPALEEHESQVDAAVEAAVLRLTTEF